MGTAASVMSRKLEEEQRRQDETTKKAEELVSSAEQRHEAEVARLKAENASLKDHIQDMRWALKQQTELWQQEKAKNVSITFGKLPLPILEAATGLSAMQPQISTSHLLACGPALNRTYPMMTIACCNVVGFGRLAASLTPSEAVALVDKLHILVDVAFAADGVYIVDKALDACMVATGLVEQQSAASTVHSSSHNSILNVEQSRPSTRGSTRAPAFSSEDAGYETRESDEELPGTVDKTNTAKGGSSRAQLTKKNQETITASWPSEKSTNSTRCPPTGKADTKGSARSPKNGDNRLVVLGPTSSVACAAHIARAALKLMSSSIDFHIPSRPDDEQLQLRVALHSGPCHIGLVGLRQNAAGLSPDVLGYSVPAAQFTVLGRTPKEALQLCDTSLALQVRVSRACRDLLLQSDVKCHLERCPNVPTNIVSGQYTSPLKCIDSYWLVGMETFSGVLPPLAKALPPSEYDVL